MGECSSCQVAILPEKIAPSSWPRRQAVGILNGVSSRTPSSILSFPETFRLALTPAAVRLARLNVPRIQLLLGPQSIEQAAVANGVTIAELKSECEAFSPKCPLPGSPGDPDFLKWEAAVNTTLIRAHNILQKNATANTTTIMWDIWNEPNFPGGPGTGGGGYMFPSPYYTPPPRAVPYQTFWETWNRAVRLIRRRYPDAMVVGPSAAPGPGLPQGRCDGVCACVCMCVCVILCV